MLFSAPRAAAAAPAPASAQGPQRRDAPGGQTDDDGDLDDGAHHATPDPIRCTTKATSHAMTHCPTTTAAAQRPPSSRRTDAMAAMQGVYSRQNTSRLAAASGVSVASSACVPPKRTERVDTTLSLARNPAMRAVEIRQSPKPSGAKSGAISPAAPASMLVCGSATTFRWRSKVWRNQTTIVARKMTVKARWRKSLALSQSRCPTFFAPGRR